MKTIQSRVFFGTAEAVVAGKLPVTLTYARLEWAMVVHDKASTIGPELFVEVSDVSKRRDEIRARMDTGGLVVLTRQNAVVARILPLELANYRSGLYRLCLDAQSEHPQTFMAKTIKAYQKAVADLWWNGTAGREEEVGSVEILPCDAKKQRHDRS